MEKNKKEKKIEKNIDDALKRFIRQKTKYFSLKAEMPVHVHFSDNDNKNYSYVENNEAFIHISRQFPAMFKNANETQMLKAIFYHEIGHILYSDFSVIQKANQTMSQYIPELKDKLISYTDQHISKEEAIQALQSFIKMESTLEIHNIIEDGAIENSLSYCYKDSSDALQHLREHMFYKDMKKYNKQLKNEEGFSSATDRFIYEKEMLMLYITYTYRYDIDIFNEKDSNGFNRKQKDEIDMLKKLCLQGRLLTKNSKERYEISQKISEYYHKEYYDMAAARIDMIKNKEDVEKMFSKEEKREYNNKPIMETIADRLQYNDVINGRLSKDKSANPTRNENLNIIFEETEKNKLSFDTVDDEMNDLLTLFDIDRQESRKLAKTIKKAVYEKKRTREKRGLDHGNILDSSKLYRSKTDGKIFKSVTNGKDASLRVSILLDSSGSMAKHFPKAIKSLYYLCDALNELNVPFEVNAHKVINKTDNKYIKLITFNQSKSKASLNNFFKIKASGTTNEYPAIKYSLENLEKHKKQNEKAIVFILSDGLTKNRNEIKKTVDIYKKKNIDTIAISLGRTIERMLSKIYDNYAVIEDVEDLKYALITPIKETYNLYI